MRRVKRCGRWVGTLGSNYPVALSSLSLVGLGRPVVRVSCTSLTKKGGGRKKYVFTHETQTYLSVWHYPPASAALRPGFGVAQRLSAEMENAIAPAGKAAGKTVCFDCSKREIFTPSSGLKVLRRRLQTTYKVTA